MQVAQLIVTLTSALVWPVVVITAFLYFGSDLRAFLKSANEFKVKVAGMEGTLTRQLESAASLGAATAKRSQDADSQPRGPDDAELRRIADTVREAGEPASATRLSRSAVLWVDDRPQNNVYERSAMEALGIRFTISESTEDALEKLRSKRFDAVISDMGRPPDPQAGYTLLNEMRTEGIDVPFIIYASSNLPEHKALARSRGAVGSTNNPYELFQLVVSSLLRNAA